MVALVRQAGDGLAVLHAKGVVHRDIKPQNLLLTSDGLGRERLMVADLGVAKALIHASGLTDVVGTPAYMAPEQALGGGVDERADVHGLAAVAYQLLTGHVARNGGVSDLTNAKLPPAPSVFVEVSPEVDAAILRGLEPDREDALARRGLLRRGARPPRSRARRRPCTPRRARLRAAPRGCGPARCAPRRPVPGGGDRDVRRVVRRRRADAAIALPWRPRHACDPGPAGHHGPTAAHPSRLRPESGSMTDVFELSPEHEQVVFCNDPATGLRAIIALHNTALGPGLGGTRFYPYASTDAAVRDVLDLSRGMTYKNSLAGLDLGGGKAVIIGDPATMKSEALLRAYGRFVQSLHGRYLTACDVGTYSEDMDHVARECDFVTGRTVANGGAGDSSVLTAYGVFQGMRAAAEAVWGEPTLAGRTVGIAGVGKVGRHLVRHLTEDGASRRGDRRQRGGRRPRSGTSTPACARWPPPRRWWPSRWTSTPPTPWAARSPTRWSRR